MAFTRKTLGACVCSHVCARAACMRRAARPGLWLRCLAWAAREERDHCTAAGLRASKRRCWQLALGSAARRDMWASMLEGSGSVSSSEHLRTASLFNGGSAGAVQQLAGLLAAWHSSGLLAAWHSSGTCRHTGPVHQHGAGCHGSRSPHHNLAASTAPGLAGQGSVCKLLPQLPH